MFVLLLVYLICSAKSCSDDGNMNEHNILIVSKDSIKQSFQINLPSDRHLRAYETTAKQKLADFAEFLKIASDTSVDAGFRQQASDMAANLFISREASLGKWGRAFPGANTLEKLLIKSLSEGFRFDVRPDMIELGTPLKQINDSSFKGSLSFHWLQSPCDNTNQPATVSSRFGIAIYALKKSKSFGNENLTVWNVFLGDFE